MNPLRIAVIGGGHLGRIHTRIIKTNPAAELVGVAETCPETRRALENEFQVTTADHFRNLPQRIDAAIVATPTGSHYPIAVELLGRGIHTFIEKPLTNTTPQADHLIHAADRQNLALQVGHVERFNPAFEQASRQLPNPRYLEAHRMSGYTFRSVDVGVVMDLMIHDIDLVASLVASPLVDTRAVGVTVFGPHEDIAQARLEFANGTVANLTASRCSFQPARKITWFSENGYVAADMADGTVEHVGLSSLVDTSQTRDVAHLDESRRETIRDELFETVLPRATSTSRPHNAIEQEQLDFIESIRKGRPPRVTGRHGRRAVSIAQAIIDSMEQHRWQDGHGHRGGPQGQKISLLPVESLASGPGSPVAIAERRAG